VTALDATGLQALENFADVVHQSGRDLHLCGGRQQPAAMMRAADFAEHVGGDKACRG
jgi:SulP family sulfate permease